MLLQESRRHLVRQEKQVLKPSAVRRHLEIAYECETQNVKINFLMN